MLKELECEEDDIKQAIKGKKSAHLALLATQSALLAKNKHLRGEVSLWKQSAEAFAPPNADQE